MRPLLLHLKPFLFSFPSHSHGAASVLVSVMAFDPVFQKTADHHLFSFLWFFFLVGRLDSFLVHSSLRHGVRLRCVLGLLAPIKRCLCLVVHLFPG